MMSVQHYEILFLLDSTKTSGNLDTAKAQLHSTLEKHGAEILASRPWDDRRLAYPIKSHKKGLYYLTFFRSEGKNLATIEHDISLNEMVVRSLILYVDPKHVEAML